MQVTGTGTILAIFVLFQLVSSQAWAESTLNQECRTKAQAIYAAAKLRDEQKNMQTAIRHLQKAGYSARLAFDSAIHVYRYTQVSAADLFQQELNNCGLGSENIPPPNSNIAIKSPECLQIEQDKQSLQRQVDNMSNQVDLLAQRIKLTDQIMDQARKQVDPNNSETVVTYNKSVTDYNDFVYQHYRLVSKFNELQLELERKTHEFYHQCGTRTRENFQNP